MENCVFCNIISGVQPTTFLFEDEEIIIFEDIKPASTYHYLAIPKTHIKNCKSLTTEHRQLIEKLVETGKNVLKENGADLEDLRLGFHIPPFNSVQHLHLHLITPISEMSFLGRMVFKPNTWWFTTVECILDNLQPHIL